MENRIIKLLLLISVFFEMALATQVIEDAEDQQTTGWSVRSGDDAVIRNVFDAQRQSFVIELRGNRTNDAYIVGAEAGAEAWNNQTDRFITWSMRFAEDSVVYVAVQTTFGLRYLFYTPSHNRGLLHGFAGGIHHGLGSAIRDGRWRTITRDLERDLKDAEPENELLVVNGLIVRGSGRLDDIILYNAQEEVYENGESGVVNWSVSDNAPQGATLRTVEDRDLQGRTLQGNVIRFNGAGIDNAYRIGATTAQNGWNNRGHHLFQWRFRTFGSGVEVLEDRGTIQDEDAFEFRIYVETADGNRELSYTLGEEHRGLDGITIHHGLGDDRMIGSVWAGDDPMNALGLWQAVTRDVEEDIRDFEPDNRLLAIHGFQVRGNGLVDEIKTLTQYDGETQGWRIYDNTPDGATIRSLYEVSENQTVVSLEGERYENAYINDGWSDRESNSLRWRMNYNEAFTIYVIVQTDQGQKYVVYNAVDEDRGIRGDYFRLGLGEESDNGTWQTFSRNLEEDMHRLDPSIELTSVEGMIIRGSGLLGGIDRFVEHHSEPIVYEDAEDAQTQGWRVYTDLSGEAKILNINDTAQESRVITLRGDAYRSGYLLGGRSATDGGWNNQTHQTLAWSLNYREAFVVYIPIETTGGRRYLVYSARDEDRGINGEYIRLGLGSDTYDGTWRTFTRNIVEDLHRYEPDNELLAIHGFMIRGSGYVDNIVLMSE